MSEQSPWKDDEVLAHFKKRSLENMCPSLKVYLYAGANVLDVGCGPGSITLDVAAQVSPGSVVGVDREEKAVEEALALAEKVQARNATFQVGDADALEFEEETFDITYSTHLLVHLREPLPALLEQKRVTKQGGKLMALIGDNGLMVIYPPCPAFEEFWAALSHLNDPSDTEAFMNLDLGRQAVALFSQAGLADIKIEGHVVNCAYPGSVFFDDRYELLQNMYLNIDGPGNPLFKKLMDRGVLDEKTILAAKREIEAWYNHPHAFYAAGQFLAVGNVA